MVQLQLHQHLIHLIKHQVFSQIKYTGNSTNDGQKVPHGLGAAPEVIIVKSLASSSQWSCYFKSLGNTKAIVLNTPAAPETDAGTGSYNYWYRTDPDSVNFYYWFKSLH